MDGPTGLKKDLLDKRGLGSVMAWKTDEGDVETDIGTFTKGKMTRVFDKREYPTYLLGKEKIRWTTLHGESAGALFSQVPLNIRAEVEAACIVQIKKGGYDKIKNAIDTEQVLSGDVNGTDPGGTVGLDVELDIDLESDMVCKKN